MGATAMEDPAGGVRDPRVVRCELLRGLCKREGLRVDELARREVSLRAAWLRMVCAPAVPMRADEMRSYEGICTESPRPDP
jgi:hypothetical protein